MKKLFLFLCSIFLLVINVKANNINSIKMDIYVDSNGTAHVKEIWNTYLNEGTEGYRSYTNLGGASVGNFKVSDNVREYTSLSSWNGSASFSDKAYKSGINKISDGVELCFGISKYGNNIYTLTYDIKGFIIDLIDSQMIYWNFVNSSLAKLTDSVYIKIYADQKFLDTLDVWGYGNYGGYAYVYDGYIEISNNNLSSDEYMVGLVKFDKGTFNTSNHIDQNFEYYYEMAEGGANHYVDTENKLNVFVMIINFIVMIFGFVFVIVVIILISNATNNKSGSYKLDFGEKGKKLPKTVNMFRDIPCNKDIIRAYWVAYNYGLMKQKTDFLGAILLKWLKQKHVEIKSNTVGKIFKKEESSIVFTTQNPALDNGLEKELYNYMYTASKDGILESREFEKWCQNNYSKILDWFDKVLDYESNKLLIEGMLTMNTKKVLGVFSTSVYSVDSRMYDEAVQMKGLKEFFNYFKNMEDKQAIEVMLWEEYLMYAQIFGVAREVAEQFAKLYPDVITNNDYQSVIFVRNITYSGMVSANTARNRAVSYSSGGGGFSSGGGGGGSFGGGGGGFR